MKNTLGILCLLIIAISGNGQGSSTGEFSIEIQNESRSRLFCRFSDFIDEPVGPGQDLVIKKRVSPNSLPGNLFIYFVDSSIEKSNSDRPIRILYDAVPGRHIEITNDGKVLFYSNASEKYLEQYSKTAHSQRTYHFLDSMISKHRDDPASADIIGLRLFATTVPVDTIDHFYNLLSNRVKASKAGMEISNYIKGRLALHINAQVRNFTLPDTSFTKRSLSDIKSDYILLDFWFSRCGPCLESFPDLIKLYQHTDREKLEVIGISIDKASDTALWKHTIQTNHIPWVCLLDPGYSLSYYTFSLDTYPTTLLLDKDRRIVGIDPGIADIMKVLDERSH